MITAIIIVNSIQIHYHFIIDVIETDYDDDEVDEDNQNNCCLFLIYLYSCGLFEVLNNIAIINYVAVFY